MVQLKFLKKNNLILEEFRCLCGRPKYGLYRNKEKVSYGAMSANALFRRYTNYLPLFSTVVPASIFMFLSCRPFVAITTLSTGLVGVEVTSVFWLGQLTVGV